MQISSLIRTTRALTDKVNKLKFEAPVSHVYNPLAYARSAHEEYLRRFAKSCCQVLLVGMNPGPWGMAQTGVPFGAVDLVRGWLGIEKPVNQPPTLHPKRPVLGFDCKRSEVSGQRLWGWAIERFKTPEQFAERFFVWNYCPLAFFDPDGRNLTPDKLSAPDRLRLFDVCDWALRKIVNHLEPRFVVGVGKFAENRARACLQGFLGTLGGVLHPSPASPAANRGWARQAETQLRKLGISLKNP